MGPCSSHLPNVDHPHFHPRGQTNRATHHGHSQGPDEGIELDSMDQSQYYRQWLKEIQEDNYQKMKRDLEQDTNIFVLNLLLLVVQFFHNFEESSLNAATFKIAKEEEIESNLRDESIEVLKVSLLHGMPNELTKNYIHRPSRQDNEDTSHLDETKTMLLSEEILPLDFYVALKNFDIYTESQFENFMNNEGSAQEVQKPSILCMQEEAHGKEKRILPGQVKLFYENMPRNSRFMTPRDSATTNFSFRRDSDFSNAPKLGSEVEDHEARNNFMAPNLTRENEFRRSSQMMGRLSPMGKILPSIDENYDRLENEILGQLGGRLSRGSSITSASIGYHQRRSYRRWSRDTPSSGYGTSQTSGSSNAPRPHFAREHLKQLSRYKSDLTFKRAQIPSHCFTKVYSEKEDPLLEEDEDGDDPEDNNPAQESRRSSVADLTFKKYLNPQYITINFMRDVQTMGQCLGISDSAMAHAQVYGTTVRCIEHLNLERIKSFRRLYNFTPCLESRHWPRKAILQFIHRARNPLHEYGPGSSESDSSEKLQWPQKSQILKIVNDFGCNFIPILPEGGLTDDPVVNKECLDWQTNFSQAETILLNSLKHAHWRGYIYCALLFKAFISVKGPREIGLEHVRNILYEMCQQKFVNWSDEDGGQQLKNILDNLYSCLGRHKMASFFVQRQNLLRNIPTENINLVQGCLSKIRENLVVHCIGALEHLNWVKREEEFYPKFDLKTLYKLFTLKGGEDVLVYITNPTLRAPPPRRSLPAPQTKKKKKEPIAKTRLIPEMESRIAHSPLKSLPRDEDQEKVRRRYQRWQAQKLKEEEAESAKKVLHIKERKSSIDLDTPAVPKFNHLRIVMIIDLFIKHFLKMARKSIEFKAYAEATMYTMQIQNLCLLLKGMDLSGTNMSDHQILEYFRETKELMTALGPNIAKYVEAKISHLTPKSTARSSMASPQPNFHFSPRHLPTLSTNSSSFSPGSFQQRVATSLNSFSAQYSSSQGQKSRKKYPERDDLVKLPRARSQTGHSSRSETSSFLY